MTRKTFKQFLIETPVGDYQTLGNWDKGSSFKSKRDRTILRHPRAIEILKKKFNNNHHTFNLYFLNSKEAKGHRELGKKSLEWVRDNLGEEVANAVEPHVGEEDNVNIIFTNNDGDQGRPMTAWMVAHRLAHALSRKDFGGGSNTRYQFPAYKESMDTIFWHLSQIMEEYGKKSFPDSETKNDRADYYSRADSVSKRKNELIMLKFFTSVCTFKSARDNNIRDWFEVLNELFAQFVTTGKLKFKTAPKKFGSKIAFGKGTGEYYMQGDQSDVDGYLNSLANTLEYYFNDTLSDASSGILVM